MAEKTEADAEGNAPGSVPMPVLIAVVGIVGLMVGYMAAGAMMPKAAETPAGQEQEEGVDLQELKVTLSDYLTRLVELQGNAGISVEVTGAQQEGGMYRVMFDFKEGSDVLQSGEAFISPDGSLFFPSDTALDLSVELPEPAGLELEKSDLPVVELFVMSFCPFGQQAENGIGPVTELLGEKIVVEPHFVIYGSDYYQGREEVYCMEGTELCSLHGVEELNENARQACIWKNEPEKWWDYALYVNENCGLDSISECWREAAQAAGVDEGMVETCFEEEGAALMEAERALNIEKGVAGSPMIFINGQPYSGGRSSESYKTAFCGAFNEVPEECGQSLSSANSAAEGSC